MGDRVDSAVDRGLLSFALAWQLLWFIADPILWPTAGANPAVAAVVIVSIVAWALLLVAHIGRQSLLGSWARWVDMSALFVITVGIFAVTSGTAEQDWSGPASWALLPAGLAGLLLPWRAAACWLAAVLLVECGFVFGFIGSGVDEPTARDLLFPLYALSVGVISIAARHALLVQAGRATEAMELALVATQARMAAEGQSVDAHREERVLHETVLNTLVAIIRGYAAAPAGMRDALRQRCAESAHVLRALQSHASPATAATSSAFRLDMDLRQQLDELRSAGVLVQVDCEPLPVAPRVYDALLAAVREALANAARHARPQAVWLIAQMNTTSEGATVSIEVRDDGIGFDANEPNERYGLRQAIARSVEQVGGTASIAATPGAGTVVTLEWRELVVDEGRVVVASPAAFAIPVLLSLGAFAAAQLVIGWTEYSGHLADLVAFALFAALAGLLIWVGLRGAYSWWVLILVAVVSPTIYQLQAHALSSTSPDSWVEWSSGAIAALFIVLAGGGPRWGWVVLVVSWLIIQGDVLTEIRAPGMALIFAAALYGRSARRNAQRVQRNLEAEADQRIAEFIARDDVGRIQRRYGALRESRAADLLEAISTGDRDANDDAVRAEAALEERFIRTVVRVDPSLDSVHALATSLAVTARQNGVFLDVDIAEGVRVDDLPAASHSLNRALECSQPVGVARLTARREGGQNVVRLVAPIRPSSREVMLRLPLRGVDLDPADGADPDMLWEIRSDIESET